MASMTSRRHPGWLVAPGVLFLMGFFVWPMISMVQESFRGTEETLENYSRMAESSAIVRSLWVTIVLSLVVTAVCIVLGYVYTYTVIRVRPWLGRLLLGVVIVPAAINLLARIFALQAVLQDQGILNDLLMWAGLISEPLTLIRTNFAVVVGSVSMLLPMMVFPLYATMRGISPEFLLAATSLGATPAHAFWRVFLPLSMPGLLAGALLVFVQSLGYYIVPQLLGDNSANQFIGQYVAYSISQGDWGFGAAIGLAMLVLTVLTLAAASRVVRVGDVLNSSVAGRS